MAPWKRVDVQHVAPRTLGAQLVTVVKNRRAYCTSTCVFLSGLAGVDHAGTQGEKRQRQAPASAENTNTNSGCRRALRGNFSAFGAPSIHGYVDICGTKRCDVVILLSGAELLVPNQLIIALRE